MQPLFKSALILDYSMCMIRTQRKERDDLLPTLAWRSAGGAATRSTSPS